MKLVRSLFTLIRWPNLVFIALTQCIFYFGIVLQLLPPTYHSLPERINGSVFFALVSASVLIAAAGYIINDYFDINIDRVNKPEKMVVERIISRRWAILMHLVLTTVGIGISLYVSLHTNLLVVIANVVCALLLWLYSTNFKKRLLSGNIIISALTAWTILVIYFAVNTVYLNTHEQSAAIALAMKRTFKFAVLYAGFAFIISLIREVVKDIEDMEGDARYNCNTMPIAWGVRASKVFVGVWIVVLTGAIAVILVYMLISGWWLCAAYCTLLLIVPLLWVLREFYQAQHAAQYHKVSSKIKLIMLAGILSMLLIKMYI